MANVAKATEAKAPKAPKAAKVPAPNAELQAKYQDVYKRTKAHAAEHAGCDKACATAKGFRLELKALDGESRKVVAEQTAPAAPNLEPAFSNALAAEQKAIDASAAEVAAPKAKRVRKPKTVVTEPTASETAEVAAPVEAPAVEEAPAEEAPAPVVAAPKKAKKAPAAPAAVASAVLEDVAAGKKVSPAKAIIAKHTPGVKLPPTATKAEVAAEGEKAHAIIAKHAHAKAKPAPEAAKASNFLMYVGGTFYTKEDFISEAKEMGVSKRLPTFRIPSDLQVGKSRIWLVAGGERKAPAAGETEAKATSVIFGHFTPDAIEFIAGEDGAKTYSDIIAYMKTIEGAQVIEGKPEVVFKPRKCGLRKVGGTYLTTVAAKGKESPLAILDAELPYTGNHFRGLMRLNAEQVTKLESGEGIATLVADTCMTCGADLLVAPDGHKRAAVERRRIERGEEAKWFLDCGTCKAQKRADAKAAADAAAAAAGLPVTEEAPAVEEAPAEGTEGTESASE